MRPNNEEDEMPTCRWILADGSYCEQPVGWSMVEDGGEPGAPKVRQYRPFCDEHMVRSALLADVEGD